MSKGKKRNEIKWDTQFKIAIDLLELSEKYKKDKILLEEYAKTIRNPIVFDNQVRETSLLLEYTIPNPEGYDVTEDHLIGMSNITLYMIKSELYKKWKNPDDFKNTLKALQVTIICPTNLNNSKGFKKWVFPYESVDYSVNWADKLKTNGIFFLLDKNGNEVSVDQVWSEWFFQYKSYL